MPLIPSIIFQDDDIIVVNKPAGITVNRSDTTKDEMTLQDWVERGQGDTNHPERELSEKTASEFSNRAGIVHRLDKETSGIILVAKTVEAFEELQRQFKERIVKKKYIALAHGEVKPAEGEIRVPVGRLEFNRKRFGVVAGGREAVTKYRTIKNYEFRIKNKGGSEKLTLLELYPETGRTHQIRVHLKYLNHPIFADELYAGRKTARDDRRYLSRCFLHASEISFLHPRTHVQASFKSELPEDLSNFLSGLKVEEK